MTAATDPVLLNTVRDNLPAREFRGPRCRFLGLLKCLWPCSEIVALPPMRRARAQIIVAGDTIGKYSQRRRAQGKFWVRPRAMCDKDFPSAFSEVVASNADANAVVDAAQRLTYAELDAWSNALAGRIVEAAGPRPSVCLVVGGFDRLAITGMIAVLKTPHVFVALDREIPPGNIARIAEELEAGLCLFTAAAEDTVRAADLGVPAIRIDTPPVGPLPALPTHADGDHVAAYKRSSGSTGGAKTAAYSIEAMMIDALEGARINDIAPGANYAVLSTFDSAMTCAAILRCLLAGGALMPVDLRFESPRQAANRLIEAGVTHLHTTPTAFRLLTTGLPEGGRFPDVHSVFLAGEKTTLADVRLLSQTTPPDCRLRVAFASTETQLVAHTTVFPSRFAGPADFGQLDVIPGVRIEILDEDGRSLPAGDFGRVRVTSKMVSLGYMGSVEPTLAARFKTLEGGFRSFLTDDIGQLTEDGRLVLKSRTGREVKIRGRRVDLAELEDWLTAQPGISEAAVVVQPIGLNAEPRLAAFLRGEPGKFEGVAELRRRMRSELVRPMQPAAIVLIDEFPRTPNQKIDRKALEADLSHLGADPEGSFQPQGRIGQLARIWQTVLNRSARGPDDDFFDLGGDSIAATVAALMMEEEFEGPVDPGFVYRYPVLSEQARALGQIDAGLTPLSDPLIVPLTVKAFDHAAPADVLPEGIRRVFVIPGAGGHVFPFAPLAQALLPDWELVGIMHPVVLRHEPKLERIEEFSERMTRAMRSLQPHGPYVVMGYSLGGAIAHEMGLRLAGAGEKAAILIVDTQVPKLATFRRRVEYLVQRDWIEWLKFRLGVADDPIGRREDQKPDPIEHARAALSFDRMARVLWRYRPGRSSAPTILIKAAETRERFEADDLGWGRVASLKQIVVSPGNHDDLFDEPHVSALASTVRASLQLLRAEIGDEG